MTVTTRESRQRILDELAGAVGELNLAVACLGEAFELLAVGSADRLETELFRPVQRSLGTAKRTHAGFADRAGIEAGGFEAPSPGLPSQGAKAFVERAVAASGAADRAIAGLQDSMLPIESGDAELRAGLNEARELLGGLPNAAREFLRGLGR